MQAWPLRALGLAAAACAGNCAYAAHYYRPVPQFPGYEYTPSKRRLLDVGDDVGTHPLPPLPPAHAGGGPPGTAAAGHPRAVQGVQARVAARDTKQVVRKLEETLKPLT